MPHPASPPIARTGLLHIPHMDADAGAALRRLLQRLPGVYVVQESYAAGERNWIEDTLCRWCDEEELDLLLTVGGTLPAPGPSGREITPEATLSVIERNLPGVSEAMRAAGRAQTPLALLDRGVAGIRGRTLLLNLPAGSGPATLFLEAVIELIGPILAHLRDDPAAPSLGDVIGDRATPSVSPDASASGETPPRSASGKGLNAEDFAAFLRRRKAQGE
jgi:molybdopterin adenylyltransferase